MRRLAAIVCIMLVSAVLPGSVGADGPRAQAAILFASDGMRPDLVERYARGGFLPTMRHLIRNGVRGHNGAVPALPPNTGTGWTTLATGAWPGVHGSTNNTFHETGTLFTSDRSAFATGIVQAETLGEAAERAGKTALFMEWPASRFFSSPPRNFKGVAVDFRSFFSRRGIITNFNPPGVNCNALANSNPSCALVTLAPATGWVNVPASERPARETTLVVVTTFAAKNPTRTYNLYIYDSTTDGVENFDRVIVATAKNGNTAVAQLHPGQGFVEIKVELIVTMTDPRQAAGLYLKLIDMTPNLSAFRVHFTSIARVNANQPAVEEDLAARFPTTQAADFAPLESGLIPEEVYVEGGLLWEHSHWPILRHLVATLNPDLLILGTPLTDEFQHQFLALVTRTAPVFDDADRNGVPDGRVHEREAFIRRAYESADMTLRLAMDLMPPHKTAVFISSDHGFAPTWRTVNADRVLFQAGLTPDPDVAPTTSNCRPGRATDVAKACTSGATAQIYINLKGRDNPGVVDHADYENVRRQIVHAFAGLRDGGVPVVDRIFLKEDLERIRIGGRIQNVTHPTRTGDVVVVLKAPGYQFTASRRGVTIADNQVFGQHGHWPDAVDLRRNVNLHITFIMAGPGIRSGVVLRRVAMADIAPTLAVVLGIPTPAHSQGRVLRPGLLP
ncbi:MAG: alkaline phosphatase family protein [bacterium]